MKANTPKKKMDSIRIDTGVKRIEVNDDGETITLNFADQSFPARYFQMVDEFEAKSTEFQKQAQELDEKEMSEYEKQRAIADFNLEIHEFFKERIDGLFGPETCRKVFGDIVPAMDLYMDFLNQLAPFFQKYGKERQKKLAQKYNLARKGNV